MPDLYLHPFAAFASKALIAACEREVAFAFRMVDPDNRARIADCAAAPGSFRADRVQEIPEGG